MYTQCLIYGRVSHVTRVNTPTCRCDDGPPNPQRIFDTETGGGRRQTW